MAHVLLTGASGFVGAFTLARLVERGHTVTAFVRTPEKLKTALAPLGLAVDGQKVVVAQGDMTDRAAVGRAVEGAERVVHVAAVYSFRRKDRPQMMKGNAEGTRLVIDAAVAAGCERVVHTSSTVALNRRGGGVLDHTSPLGEGFGPYSDSKVASERIAREAQEAGKPVSIVNPGGVIGPHDPYLGESNQVILDCVRGKLGVWPRGGMTYVDVRDTAATLVAAMEHDSNGRWLVPGHDAAGPHEIVSEVTGKKRSALRVPTALAVAGTMPGYLTGWAALPGQAEGTRIAGCGNTTDSSATTRDLGVRAMPFAESVRDTLDWLRTQR